ncbi:MAG: type II toxin-antitoxin system HicA family toxin [Dehalococcoidia bacterium]|nr:type II toxin-antitoxin system HicA family toxin [Dehalococcoidia bacterium]
MAPTFSRRELISKLHSLGFEGPFPGGRHEFMRRGRVRLILPNPHRGDIDTPLLRRMIRQAGISQEEWDEA